MALVGVIWRKREEVWETSGDRCRINLPREQGQHEPWPSRSLCYARPVSRSPPSGKKSALTTSFLAALLLYDCFVVRAGGDTLRAASLSGDALADAAHRLPVLADTMAQPVRICPSSGKG